MDKILETSLRIVYYHSAALPNWVYAVDADIFNGSFAFSFASISLFSVVCCCAKALVTVLVHKMKRNGLSDKKINSPTATKTQEKLFVRSGLR